MSPHESGKPEGAVDARLRRLAAAAEAHDVTLLSDDEHASVGTGRGSRTWPLDALPDPDDLDWTEIHDVPVALVTGDGTAETVRMLEAMILAADLAAGVASSEAQVAARALLRNRSVDIAVIATRARDVARHGLPTPRAAAAVVLQGGDDAETRLALRNALHARGRLVLNVDDPALEALGAAHEDVVAWCSLEAAHPELGAHVAMGGEGAWLEGDTLVQQEDATRRVVLTVGEIHGATETPRLVACALAATLTATRIGLSLEEARQGLKALRW